MKTTITAIIIAVILAATAVWYWQRDQTPPAPLTLTSLCNGTSADNHCAPFVGCIANSDVTFEGRANGYFGGDIVGTMSNGATCQGSWKATSPRSGEAATNCGDGTSFTGSYLRKNSAEGYVVGKGATDAAQTVFAVSSSLAYRTGRVTPPDIPRLHEICKDLLNKG